MSYRERASLDQKIADLHKHLKRMREIIDETEAEISLTQREVINAIRAHDIAAAKLQKLEEDCANLESGAFI